MKITMSRTAGLQETVGPSKIDLRVPAVILAAALLYTTIEFLAGDHSPELAWVVQWRMFPAFLWAAASGFLVREGARRPELGRSGLRIAGWAALFVLLHATVNTVIRLPDAALRGPRWLTTSTVDGAIHHAPAALLLFVVLVGTGRLVRQPPAPRSPAEARPEALVLPGGDRTHRVAPARIRWLEAEGDYVRVHTTERSYLVRETMKALEGKLASGRFVRIHRSTLVGVDFVREVRPIGHGDHVAVLDDGTELRIPRTRRRALDRLRDG